MNSGTDLALMTEQALGRADWAQSSSSAGASEYDLLRLVIWSLTRAQEPAHVVRIMNCAVELARSAAMTSETVEVLRDRLRERLEALAEAGDVAPLDEGRWLPAPVRAVPLGHGSGAALLVGGIPTASLPGDMSATILAHGAYRRVRSAAALSALGLPIEPVEAWTQAPPEPIQEWGRTILDAPLPEYQEPVRDESAFRVYLPSKSRPGTTQARRWSTRPGDSSGRFLAERSRVFGAREYRVVELARGRVVRSGNSLGPGEASRLRYALDALSGNPTRVSWREDHDHIMVTLWSSIPRPEQRLFAALGSLVIDERSQPKRWRFARADAAVVRARLEALAVTVAHA